MVASLAGCDQILTRHSFVKVAPNSFPSCAAAALTQAGFKSTLFANSNEEAHLYVNYPHGDLNITAIKSASGQSQTVVLRVTVIARSEPSTEAKLGEDLGVLTAAIARGCGEG